MWDCYVETLASSRFATLQYKLHCSEHPHAFIGGCNVVYLNITGQAAD